MRKPTETRRKITQFPKYLFDTIEFKKPPASGLPAEEDNVLWTIFTAEQFFDVLEGMAYAEQHFLTRALETFSSEEFEQFIFNLHRIVARSTTLLFYNGSRSGQIAEANTLLTKETGQSECPVYEVTIPPMYTESSYHMVGKLHGQKTADAYLDFAKKLFESFIKAQLDIDMKLDANVAQKVFKKLNVNISELMDTADLKDHPGRPYFLETADFITRSTERVRTFKLFCQKLWVKIQNKEEPLLIAAYALSLGRKQIFGIGNGAVSRLFSNCLLMQYGYYPINWHKYYRFFQAIIQEKHHQNPLAITIDDLQKDVPTDPQSLEPIVSYMKIICYGAKRRMQSAFKGSYGYYIVANDNLITYQNILQTDVMIAKQTTANYLDHDVPVLKPLQIVVMNADAFYQRATRNRFLSPIVAIYYFARAAQLYEQQGNQTRAYECYNYLTDLCYQQENMGACYDYAQSALALTGARPIAKKGLESRASELRFVVGYRLSRMCPDLFYAPQKESKRLAEQSVSEMFFPYLDKMSSLFNSYHFAVVQPENKQTGHQSSSGWQLFAIKDSYRFLAILVLRNQSDVTKLALLLQQPPLSFTVKAYTEGKMSAIGLYLTDVAQLAKQVEHLPQILAKEYSQGNVLSTPVVPM